MLRTSLSRVTRGVFRSAARAPRPPLGVRKATASPARAPTFTTQNPRDLVRSELRGLASSIRATLGADHPALKRVASYFFHKDGKQFRPMVVLLMSRALAADAEGAGPRRVVVQEELADVDLVTGRASGARAPVTGDAAQQSLAEIAEMIHTASLLHDDVIDGAETRRGIPAAHVAFGNKVAVLGGDFLLAKASICTARLGSLQVVELISSIVEDLVEGEFMQGSEADRERTLDFDYYMKKTFLKTASLLAKTCRASAVLTGAPESNAEAAFLYGKHLGLSFQIVDDLLDFTSTAEELGKPAGSDLSSGVPTAPVIFTSHDHPEIAPLAKRGFSHPEDCEKVNTLVFQGDAIVKTVELAKEQAELAVSALSVLPESSHRIALESVARDVAARGEASFQNYVKRRSLS